jgi:fructosamine-3-kinase
MWTQIATRISEVTGKTFEINQRRSVPGGCINQGYAVSGNTGTYFVKFNQASKLEMFEAEALGLRQMLATDTIRVPKPICVGTAVEFAYIVLEWLELGSGNNTESWEALGCQLAAMHCWHPLQSSTPPNSSSREGSQNRFGWDVKNTIGSTPQINTWTSNWAEFFAEYRLGYQFKLARSRGGHFPLEAKVMAAVPKLLNHQPQPSVVHGDLWGGNAGITTSGEPVIFDPAVYIGDREVDIAMTELFGGFPTAFYRGYGDICAMEEGYKRRKTLYNLYHILNHFNLFGGGYGSQANRMMEQIID